MHCMMSVPSRGHGATKNECRMDPVRWTPAEFFERPPSALPCTLCPYFCQLDDGDVGRCKVRRRRGPGMETATFTTAVQHVDAIERKPFYHLWPGSATLPLGAPGG